MKRARLDTIGRVWHGDVFPVGSVSDMNAELRKVEAYRVTPFGFVFPEMSFSQASAHSRMMSIAYLQRLLVQLSSNTADA